MTHPFFTRGYFIYLYKNACIVNVDKVSHSDIDTFKNDLQYIGPVLKKFYIIFDYSQAVLSDDLDFQQIANEIGKYTNYVYRIGPMPKVLEVYRKTQHIQIPYNTSFYLNIYEFLNAFRKLKEE